MQFDNRSGPTCNDKCKGAIEQSLGVALSVWKSTCGLCSDDFMTHFVSESRIYIDARIANWLQTSPATPYPLQNKEISAAVRTKELVKGGKVTATRLGAVPELAGGLSDHVVGYVRVTDELSQKICTSRVEREERARSLRALKDAACGRKSAKRSEDDMHMTLRLLNGETSCRVPKGSAKAIACGVPDKSIELSFGNNNTFSFEDFSSGTKMLLGPKKGADYDGTQVLIHEVGHWFGLRHIMPPGGGYEQFANVKDIMQDYHQSDACMTAISVNLINAMSDEGIQKAYRLGGALLPKNPRQQ
jgi:hypothetical protein